MKRRPQKGSVDWVSLHEGEKPLVRDPSFAEVFVGITYVGGKEARRWSNRLGQLESEELNRRFKAREGQKKECAPELWSDDYRTPEYMTQFESLVDDVFAGAVAGVRGVEGLSDEDKDGALELLEDMNGEERFRLMARCINNQSLSRPQFPASASSGDAEA